MALFCSLLTFCFCNLFLFTKGEETGNDVELLISNSCVGKEDGEYWLKLSSQDQDYLPVKLQCSNEYVILDYNKDSNIQYYFSSFLKWHYAAAGPSVYEPVTWNEWFLNEDMTKDYDSSYLVSPDCSVCDETSSKQIADTHSTYWLTGNIVKQFWWNLVLPLCDMDWDSEKCKDCSGCNEGDTFEKLTCSGAESRDVDDFDDVTDWALTGVCTNSILESYHKVAPTRYLASHSMMDGSPNYKPSIGLDGRFCVCFKPEMRYVNHEISISQDEIEKANQQREADKEEEIISNKEDVFHLSQSDFLKGTYRIKKSGTYIITEDIIFDFNADSDYPYWPDDDQQEEYPGAQHDTFRDAYHMGFFAGITIEADDVTIDLNGFELKQSVPFYFQQRWFATIELSSQQFLPGEGPAFYGDSPAFVNNVVIKNGVLGLTSHFAIHGNNPTNVLIENVHIKDFVTHGMQLNGWEYLTMNNVEIGPSSTIEYLRGDYGHARLILPRLWYIEDKMSPEERTERTVGFKNRAPVTINGISTEMQLQMNMAYEYALNRVSNKYADHEYLSPGMLSTPEKKRRWLAAKKQFINENGLPCATSLIGIFLNAKSASVFKYTMYTEYPSEHATLTNVKIHDLRHSLYEVVRLSIKYDTSFFSPWASHLDGRSIFGSDEKLKEFSEIIYSNINNDLTPDDQEYDLSYQKFEYVGNILTDAYIAMYKLSDDWGAMGVLTLDDTSGIDGEVDMKSWATVGTACLAFTLGCNNDIMSHSGKGILGMRLEGVSDVTLDNVDIYNLYQETPLGLDVCGEYTLKDENGGGGNAKQKAPMQVGFSGNMVQGMSIITTKYLLFKNNINVYNLQNNYGESYGISFWMANRIMFDENVQIRTYDINSGILLEQDTFTYESRPNRAPESCGLRYDDGTSYGHEEFLTLFTISDSTDGDNTEWDYSGNLDQINQLNIFSCNIQGHVGCYGQPIDEDDNINGELHVLSQIGGYLGQCDDLLSSQASSVQDTKLVSKKHHNVAVNNNGGDNNANIYFYSLIVIVSVISVILFPLMIYFGIKKVNNYKSIDSTITESTPLVSYNSNNDHFIIA